MCLTKVVDIANTRPCIATFLIIFGGLSFFRLFYKTLVAFSQTCLLSGHDLKKYGAKKGAWAVVTGASDGLGKEFALQLAQKGFNVMVVARNAQALNAVAQEIKEKYNVQSVVKLIDFANADEATYDKWAEEVAELGRFGVLINNVGVGHEMPVHFVESSLDEMKRIIDVNITANLRACHALLPIMVKQRNGLVLNIGSFSGSTPCAMLSTYSASKAFLSHFTDALAQEMKQHGVTVQLTNTYFVVSKLSKIRRPSMFIPTPKPYVRSVLNKIGLAGGAAYTGRPASMTPYWSHALLDWALHVVDWKWLHMRSNYTTQKDIRRRALAKKEREAKAQ